MRWYRLYPKFRFWKRRISRLQKDLKNLKPRQKYVLLILGIIVVLLIRNFWMNEATLQLRPKVRDEFLVNQPGCKIPNPEVADASKVIPRNTQCPFQGCEAYTKIVTVYNATKTITVKITTEAEKCGDPTHCCAVAYSMPIKSREAIRYPVQTCYQIKPVQEIQPTIYTEVLEITCHDLCDNRKIINFHPLLPIAPKVQTKLRTWTRSEFRRAMVRVIVLSIDNVSQEDLLKNLPQTMNEVQEQGFYQMRGYSMIENSTTGNFLSLLTGFNSSGLMTKCSIKTIGIYDGCPFIWKDFRNFDYVTLFMDQSLFKTEAVAKTSLTTANFIAQPTDFFIPATFINDHMRQNQEDPRLYNSFASTSPTDFILDFTEKFIRKFTNFPFLSVSRLSPTSNSMYQLDNKLLKFFRKVSMIQNVVVIFSSNIAADGGKPNFRRPFLYISVPSGFPEAQKRNLKTNSERLVTSLDVHQTLHEVLFKSCRAAGSEIKECSFLSNMYKSSVGSSLFRPGNKTRDCLEAEIPMNICPCKRSMPNPEAKITF